MAFFPRLCTGFSILLGLRAQFGIVPESLKLRTLDGIANGRGTNICRLQACTCAHTKYTCAARNHQATSWK